MIEISNTSFLFKSSSLRAYISCKRESLVFVDWKSFLLSEEFMLVLLVWNPKICIQFNSLRAGAKKQSATVCNIYLDNAQKDIRSEPSSMFSSFIGSNMKLNNDEFYNSQDIVEAFTDYFSGVYLRSDPLRRYVSQRNLPVCVNLKTFSRQEILSAIKGLKIKLRMPY